MRISPDSLVLWEWGPVALNATVLFTWLVMLLLVGASWLITRRLSSQAELSRGQNLLEVLTNGMRSQIRDITQQDPDRFVPFVGTLFLFIAVANILSILPGHYPEDAGIVPGYYAPTGSLSTTAALALCVFLAVPVYGITERGAAGYLKQYIRPTPLMLPFNIISEVSRTLALAVRLFGNVMSGTMIVGILLALAPLFFPIIMKALGLLTGLVQAYIFAVLAMVYIASGTRIQHEEREASEDAPGGRKPDEVGRNGGRAADTQDEPEPARTDGDESEGDD